MSFLVHVLLEDLQPESFSPPPRSNQDPRHATLDCVGGIMKLIIKQPLTTSDLEDGDDGDDGDDGEDDDGRWCKQGERLLSILMKSCATTSSTSATCPNRSPLSSSTHLIILERLLA